MIKVFIDTDVIIDFTNSKGRILINLLTKQRQSKVHLMINPVVISEFFTDKKLKDGQMLTKAKQLFGFFTPIEISARIGYLAGDILREGKIDLIGDAFIAATCVLHNLPLVTRNKKHFAKVNELQFYES